MKNFLSKTVFAICCLLMLFVSSYGVVDAGSSSATDSGRTITITYPDGDLVAGTKVDFSVTYAVDHWPGTYIGELEVFINSPDILSISGDGEKNRSGSRTLIVWPYSVDNGSSFAGSFQIKVPPVDYLDGELSIHAQNVDSYGPLYLRNDGTAPESNLNVSRANAKSFTVIAPSSTSTSDGDDDDSEDNDSSSSSSSTSLSDSKITSIFVSVYGRNPSSSELSYWRDRSEEKSTEGELKGAMEYAKSQDDSGDDDSEDTTESHTETEDSLLVRTTPIPTPNLTDPDGDGLPNDQEELYGTDPNNFDTDGDGRPDGLEVREGSSPLLPHNPEDFDNDGVSDAEEEERGTDPRNADTDNDGVFDGDEIRAGRDPLVDEGEEFAPTEQEGEGNGEETGELPEQEEKPSFGRRLWQNLTAPFRAIGRLFSRIF